MMNKSVSGHKRVLATPLFVLVIAATFLGMWLLPEDAGAKSKSAKHKAAPQTTFASPEEAVTALTEALKADDRKALLAIFGPGSKKLVASGDRVADKTEREAFLKSFNENNRLEQGASGSVLCVGTHEYPFPIPIVKKDDRWYYDTTAGSREILDRRIGRNEISAIQFLHGYVDAQREFASDDRDGDGKLEFAQRFRSSPDKRDGLFWEIKEDEKPSPLGPLAAAAAEEGYGKKATAGKRPYHGYYFRILKSQGPNAPGGAYDYVVSDGMLLGFAAVAYPARYGVSGIMTFVVNQQGGVLQKDLGPKTDAIATAMKVYDPDKTWKEVEKKFTE